MKSRPLMGRGRGRSGLPGTGQQLSAAITWRLFPGWLRQPWQVGRVEWSLGMSASGPTYSVEFMLRATPFALLLALSAVLVAPASQAQTTGPAYACVVTNIGEFCMK